jgi:hypothetical protein
MFPSQLVRQGGKCTLTISSCGGSQHCEGQRQVLDIRKAGCPNSTAQGSNKTTMRKIATMSCFTWNDCTGLQRREDFWVRGGGECRLLEGGRRPGTLNQKKEPSLHVVLHVLSSKDHFCQIHKYGSRQSPAHWIRELDVTQSNPADGPLRVLSMS